MLFLATAVAIAVGLTMLWFGLQNVSGVEYARSGAAALGRRLFIAMTAFETAVCILLAPAITAGAISLEREQQTLDLLLLTRLSSRNIILGKLISSLSFAIMILICALPVTAIAFLLGGVDIREFWWAQGLVLAVLALAGAIGIASSVIFRKTATAAAMAYVGIIGWLTLPMGSIILVSMFIQDDASSSCLWFLLMGSSICIVHAFLLQALCWKHPFPARLYLYAWLLCGGMVLAFNYQYLKDISNHNLEYILFGQPVAAFMHLLWPDDCNFPSHSWVANHFALLSIGLTAFAAAGFMALGVRWLERARRQ